MSRKSNKLSRRQHSSVSVWLWALTESSNRLPAPHLFLVAISIAAKRSCGLVLNKRHVGSPVQTKVERPSIFACSVPKAALPAATASVDVAVTPSAVDALSGVPAEAAVSEASSESPAIS